MNYRHIYHAGNPCDVVKHAILGVLLEHFRAKEAPFAVLDTHAGLGQYDLTDPRAQKTNEAGEGVLKLMSEQIPAGDNSLLESYVGALQTLNPDGPLRYYPGSPMLVRKMLRRHDRLIACELHPEDVRELRHVFCHDPQVQVHHRDGYEALNALLPFPEKRGLVFIDPPFEKTDEIERLVAALQTIHRRMAQAVVAVWYPIKERPAIWKLHELLVASGLSKILAAEFMFYPETRHDRLNGSGFIFMNAPWKLDERLARLFHVLHEVLETESDVSSITMLTPA